MSSIRDATLLKLTLGNYKGVEVGLQKIIGRMIETKRGPRLSLTYRYQTRDVIKNYVTHRAENLVRQLLASGFRAAHLSSANSDHQLVLSKKGKARLSSATASAAPSGPTSHDHRKERLIDPTSRWVAELGVAGSSGEIRASQQAKWRQINKFVEIVASLLDKSGLTDTPRLRIVDMGSGKGYLTFGLYEYLTRRRGSVVSMTGVETRQELVEKCNKLADESGFAGLSFVSGTIDSFDTNDADILIALHACNTATDDAIHKGIVVGADLIIVAPCCHQEIRPQIVAPDMFKDVLKHGVILERMAETLTDALRALLLERSGYATRMIEFVPVEHTPKNNMLVGVRRTKAVDTSALERQIDDIKAAFGISHQRLEQLLAGEIQSSNW